MNSINILKKITFAIGLTFILSLSSVVAQDDTMYVMKDGEVIDKFNVNTEIDSIIFYKPKVVQYDTIETFIDSRDGNEYNLTKIGNQVWMAKNLAYLPSVNQVANGSEDVAGAYYYVYGYDGTDVAAAKATSNYDTYGVLYNWTAAMNGEASSSSNPSGIQGVCPTGWHLPSDAEWTELTDYLGGTSIAGGKLKKTGTANWINPNSGATNETNFAALPGGYRDNIATFGGIGSNGFWWGTSLYNSSSSWVRAMYNNNNYVFRNYDFNEIGFSVRCVKD